MGTRNRKKNRGGQAAQNQKTSKKDTKDNENRLSKSLAVANQGIRTSGDLANLFGAVICDTLDKTITVGQANVVCNAGGKILRIAEAQMRFGGLPPAKSGKAFQLPAAS